MNKIKALIPYKLRILWSVFRVYRYDLMRYLKYSAVYNRYDEQSKLRSFITKAYHVVEKGLTMPNTRLGFGREGINELVRLLQLYEKAGYSKVDTAYVHAIGVLKEYLRFHEEHDYLLESTLKNTIQKVISDSKDIKRSCQRSYSLDAFFASADSSFEEFAYSRHTVRNFTEEDVPDEVYQKCIQIAAASPSPCNRQPNRVYVVKNKEIIREILALQNGNRGFGHLGNALVVFATDLSLFHDTFERNEPFLNSGKFCMSFIFALHHYKVGSCCLNWSVSPEKDQRLKEILDIPDREAITMTLICGRPPGDFRSARSPKEDAFALTKFIV